MTEIRSQQYSSETRNDQRRFEQQRDEALAAGQLEEAARSQQLVEIAELGREKCRQAGLPLERFRVLKGGKEGNTVALGAYQQKPGAVGPMALASVETFAETAETAEEAAEHMVKAGKHEERHKVSHENALRRGEAGLIRLHLGEDVEHDLQETMAREGTTKGMDAYDAEEARVNAMKGTRTKLTRLLYEGREAEIVEILQAA